MDLDRWKCGLGYFILRPKDVKSTRQQVSCTKLKLIYFASSSCSRGQSGWSGCVNVIRNDPRDRETVVLYLFDGTSEWATKDGSSPGFSIIMKWAGRLPHHFPAVQPSAPRSLHKHAPPSKQQESFQLFVFLLLFIPDQSTSPRRTSLDPQHCFTYSSSTDTCISSASPSFFFCLAAFLSSVSMSSFALSHPSFFCHFDTLFATIR